MRQRNTFLGTAVESLEGRQLLSHAANPLAALKHTSVAHVLGTTHRAHAAAIRAAAAHPGTIHTPENTARAASAGASRTAAAASAATAATPVSSGNAVAFAGLTQNSGPLDHAAVVNQRVSAAQSRTSSALTIVSPYSIAPTPPAASTAVTTPTATTATPAAASPTAGIPATSAAPGSSAAMPMAVMPRVTMPVQNLWGGATLSKADVTALRQAVDDFAAHYTGGQDAAQDKAATDALKAGLDDVALSVWTETHVAAPADVKALRTAADNFAGSYTSGQSLAADKAAWKGLQAALSTFAGALKGADAGAEATAPGGPAALRVMPMMPPGLSGLGGPLLSGTPLTADQTATLKTAVDAFAASYTSGADAAKDSAALGALRTSLDGLAAANGPQATAVGGVYSRVRPSAAGGAYGTPASTAYAPNVLASTTTPPTGTA